MARSKKGKKFAPGTWVERDLFYSRAFLELSGFAPQLLILFLGKRHISQDKTVTNKNSITMTYVELEKIYHRYESQGVAICRDNWPKGITRPRFVRALGNLLAHGFIRIVRRGGAYQTDKSIYALVEDWRLWQPGVVFAKRDPDTRLRGYNARLRKPAPIDLSVTDETVPFIKPKGRGKPPPVAATENDAQRHFVKLTGESKPANDSGPLLTNDSDRELEQREAIRARIRTRLNLRKSRKTTGRE